MQSINLTIFKWYHILTEFVEITQIEIMFRVFIFKVVKMALPSTEKRLCVPRTHSRMLET